MQDRGGIVTDSAVHDDDEKEDDAEAVPACDPRFFKRIPYSLFAYDVKRTTIQSTKASRGNTGEGSTLYG